MAIIYSYPETTDLLPTDMLVGTSTIRVAGKKKNITKNFTLDALRGFILQGYSTVTWGSITGTLSNQTDLQAALNAKQNNITLTTVGSSGAATLIGSTLNIPNYAGGSGTSTLNQVLTAGNTSLLNAKIGELYLYDTASADYGRIIYNDSSLISYDHLGNIDFRFSSTDNAFTMYNSTNKGANFIVSALTATRNYTLPNATGTIALTSDIPIVSTPTLNQVLTVGNASLLDLKAGSLYSYDSINADYGIIQFYDSGVSIKGATTNNLLFSNDDTGSVSFSNGTYDPILNFAGVGNNVYTFQNANGTLAFLSDIPSVAGYVPTSRTLTINGTAYDLTANRTWNVGTITSVSATGPITSSVGTTPNISTSMSTNKLIGRSTAGTGIMEEISIGTGLSLSAGTLSSANSGTVTSVGLTMPAAFTVSNSPITGAGTIAITGAGTASQYIRGDGTLATLPSSGGGGGSSVNYYLNGSINASVATYKQLSNTAVIGVGTDFQLIGNGLISQFLTDVGNPNRLEIPGGAWNFEMFFSMSSNGGTPAFYVELLKYNGVTFTSIASNSTAPENITGGTSIDLYLTSLAVPTTPLLVTDRLAIRVYIVNNSGGRTATLHTEDSHLCEIITTFSGGVTSLNGLTANTQYFAVGTSGSDFNISSVTDTHTFNLPTASASNRGALSTTDWSAFNGKQNTITLTTTGTGAATFVSNTLNIPTPAAGITGSGTTNKVPKFTGSTAIGDSNISDSGTLVTIATDALINGLTVGRGGGNINSNTAIGLNALQNNTTGGFNTLLGYFAGSQLTGTSNIFIGSAAGSDATTSKYSTIIGGHFDTTLQLFNQNSTLSIEKQDEALNNYIGEIGGLPHIWSPETKIVGDGGTSTLIQLSYELYSAIFIEYNLEDTNGSARAGSIKAVWDSTASVIKVTEETTADIGSTGGCEINFNVGGGFLNIDLDNNNGYTVYCNTTSRILVRPTISIL